MAPAKQQNTVPLRLWWELADKNKNWFTIDSTPMRDGKDLQNTLAVVYQGGEKPVGPDTFDGYNVIYTDLDTFKCSGLN